MRSLYLIGVALVVVAGAGVATIWNGRVTSTKAEADERRADEAAGLTVRLAKAEISPPVRKLELQGEARPFASVTLYAKVSGYLQKISVDKGDRVQKGQLVAVIESPEVDRQFDAAQADARYKRAEAKRTASLAGPGVVSAQQAELEGSQADVAEAQVAALRTAKSYEELRAPFSGTVTARFADPGALVQNATNAQTSALPVVTVSQIDRLRVYIYVDQKDAASVKNGDHAEIKADGVSRTGQVTRLSHELDLKTRMMLVEIDLDNRDGAIVPGSFVQVGLQIAVQPRVQLPVSALVIRDQKPFVPVVESGVIKLRAVEVAEYDGARVRLLKGVNAGEEAALDLGDAATEGAHVRPKN